MSTKNNPLFESPTPAITPLALRPRDAAALGVSGSCYWSGGRITGAITRHQHPLSCRNFS